MESEEEMIRYLQPLIGEQADYLWETYLASDLEGRRLIRQHIENLYYYIVDDYRKEKILLLPPSTLHQLLGQFPLGEVWYTKPLYPFSLTEKELVQHIGVFGRTGAGKTYLIRSFLTHLKRPVIVFDWKGNYTASDTLLFTPGSSTHPFYFNPLDLKEIAPEFRQTYIRQVIELLIDCYFENLQLLTVQGVEYLLLLCVNKLSGKSITFHDICKWIKSYEGTYRERDWKSSALNILFKITTGPLGKILQESDVRLEWLTKQRIVFELSNVGNSKDKSFFIRVLLLRLYYHFEKLGTTNQLRLFIVIEEAHNILLKKGTGHETIIELMLRQIREFGVGICIIDQHPSLISLPALGTYCTVAFNLRLKQDQDAMASALCLDQKEYLGRLPPRFAIVKIQDRFMQPFLIKTYDLLQKTPNHQSQVIRVVRQEEEDISDFSEVLRDRSPVIQVIRRAANRRKKKLLWEEVFLVHTYLFPLIGTVERYKDLCLNSYQGNRIKESLVRKGLACLEPVPTSTGRKKLIVPTRKGFEWLKSRGFSTRSDKCGGILHQYWKRRLRDQFRNRRYRVEVEAKLPNNQAIDLLIADKVAVEIETGKNNYEQILKNSRKSSQVVLFVLKESLVERLSKEIDAVVVSEERDCITEVMRLMGDTE
jgi:hypothetical protein